MRERRAWGRAAQGAPAERTILASSTARRPAIPHPAREAGARRGRPRPRAYFFFAGSGITIWQASRHVAEGPRCHTCTYQAESAAAEAPVTNVPYV